MATFLLASSSTSKDAVRIVDTITNFTLPNWPTKNTPLNKVFSSDFHPCSTHLAIGNARGRGAPLQPFKSERRGAMTLQR